MRRLEPLEHTLFRMFGLGIPPSGVPGGYCVRSGNPWQI
jgi:hypothetical protein